MDGTCHPPPPLNMMASTAIHVTMNICGCPLFDIFLRNLCLKSIDSCFCKPPLNVILPMVIHATLPHLTDPLAPSGTPSSLLRYFPEIVMLKILH